ncbi:hypothetical protein LWI28_002492 [Acer negundo]|uniref:Uncharacterized protein n=1 Tax=Acer negundo TaxID=4023 RepID=A0AAD5NUM2_ACENE|nr:hypothetical protein LWI28_002492 [Acer negundo]
MDDKTPSSLSTTNSSSSQPSNVNSSDNSSLVTSPSTKSFSHPLSIKLDSTNFLLWKNQVFPILEPTILTSLFLEHTFVHPKYLAPDSVINPEYQVWMKQDKLHFSWLLTTLSEGVQTQKVGLTTSHQLWTEIKRIFMSTVEARAMNLLSELQTTKKGALSMNEYLQRMKTVFDNLAAIGEPIAKKQLNQYVLGGLGPEYDAFVATATSRAITYEELRGFLLSHEGRIERYNNLTSNSSLMPSANVATLQNNRNNGQCSQYYRVLLGLKTKAKIGIVVVELTVLEDVVVEDEISTAVCIVRFVEDQDILLPLAIIG